MPFDILQQTGMAPFSFAASRQDGAIITASDKNRPEEGWDQPNPTRHGLIHRDKTDALRRQALRVQSRAPLGKHFPENPLPSDHVMLLNSEGDANRKHVGLRRLGRTFNQTTETPRKAMKISVGSLLGWVDQLVGEERVYLSQADFFWGAKGDSDRHRTTAAYLNSIGTVFVDLDVYSDKEGSDPENADRNINDVAKSVLQVCDEAFIPRPLLISSGRGLYAEWVLDRRLKLRDPQNTSRWKAVQRKLIGLLEQFGSDRKVTDITRVLRLVGTRNEKTGTLVRVVHDDGRTHSLRSLELTTNHLPDYADDDHPTVNTMKQTRSQDGTTKKANRAPGHSTIPSSSIATPEVRNNNFSEIPHGIDGDKPVPYAFGPTDPQSIRWLQDLIASDEPKVQEMGKLRRRNYRMFEDIAHVVTMRNGIRHGDRDEFQFWMLVCRYNAGILDPDDLPPLAAKMSLLSDGHLDLWKSGMLTTLYARMTNDPTRSVTISSPGCPKRKILRQKGAFAAVMYLSSKEQTSTGKSRPLVYTPSAATLVSKLGIRRDEQTELQVLVCAQEKDRRKRAKSSGAMLDLRNSNMRQAQASGMDVSSVAAQFGVSLATAYRVLACTKKRKKTPIVKPSSITRGISARESRSTAQSQTLALLNESPDLSIRDLAKLTGASPASVHRWTSRHKKQLNTRRDHSARKSQHKAQTILARIALNEQHENDIMNDMSDSSHFIRTRILGTGFSRFTSRQKKADISISSTSASVSHSTFDSHSSPHTMEGITHESEQQRDVGECREMQEIEFFANSESDPTDTDSDYPWDTAQSDETDNPFADNLPSKGPWVSLTPAQYSNTGSVNATIFNEDSLATSEDVEDHIGHDVQDEDLPWFDDADIEKNQNRLALEVTVDDPHPRTLPPQPDDATAEGAKTVKLDALKRQVTQKANNSDWAPSDRKRFIALIDDHILGPKSTTQLQRDRKMMLIGNASVRAAIKEFYSQADTL